MELFVGLDVSAVARRLAIILHRMWVDGTEYRWEPEQAFA